MGQAQFTGDEELIFFFWVFNLLGLEEKSCACFNISEAHQWG